LTEEMQFFSLPSTLITPVDLIQHDSLIFS
jgi:hypothetical protein